MECILKNKVSIRKNRNSSIEALRIMAMVFILLHHWSIGILQYCPTNNLAVYIPFQAIFVLGKIGVDIFFVITGFVMATSTKWSVKKILKVCLEVLFYSLIWFIGDMILIKNGFYQPAEYIVNLSDSFSIFNYTWYNIFNFAGSGWYWFPTTYIFILLISPFLSFLMKKLPTKGQLILVVTMFILCSVFPSIGISGHSSFQLIALESFFAGAFVRLHLDYFKKWRWIGFAVGIGCIVLQAATNIGLNIGLINSPGNPWYSMALNWEVGAVAATTFCSALGFLIFFSTFEFSNSIVNIIASTTYGIYLFHAGPTKFFSVIFNYQKIFTNENPGLQIFYSFLYVVLGILVVGIVIDLIRQLFENLLFEKALKKVNFFCYDLSRDGENK